MKIAVYDTQHEETLFTVIRIFDNGENELHVFTTPEFGTALQQRHLSHHIQWHLMKPVTALDFPAAITRENRKHRYTHIILSTVHKHHLLFAFFGKAGSKLLVVLHDTNVLNPKFKLGLRALLRNSGMRLLNRMADGFIVLSSEVKKYIKQEKMTQKPVMVMPGAVWEEKGNPGDNGDFIITIPGTADETRRDYEELLRLEPLLSPATRNIRFVVLGYADEKGFITIISFKISDKSDRISVNYFPSTIINQDEFDQQMKQSHLVYLPLRASVVRPEGVEYYGRTKISGGFFDAVRFSRIILQPAAIPVAEELKDQTHTYASVEELAQWINAAVNDPEFLRRAQQKADKNASRFELESVRKSVLTQLGSI